MQNKTIIEKYLPQIQRMRLLDDDFIKSGVKPLA